MKEYSQDKEIKKSELNEDFPATPMQTVKYVFALSVTVVLGLLAYTVFPI